MSELKAEPCPNPNCNGAMPTPSMVLSFGGLFELQCEQCGRSVCSQIEADCIAAWNRRADGWQPIETARGRTEILLYFPEDGSMDVMSWGQHPSGDYCFMNACLDRGDGATHWMPTPPPPTGEEE